MYTNLLKKYFIFFVALVFSALVFSPSYSYAQASNVCITENDAVDLITLLDASERDLARLGTCDNLVKELYQELELKDKKIESLTEELIHARQDVLKYRAQNKTLKRIAWTVGIGGAIIIVLEVLPVLL